MIVILLKYVIFHGFATLIDHKWLASKIFQSLILLVENALLEELVIIFYYLVYFKMHLKTGKSIRILI